MPTKKTARPDPLALRTRLQLNQHVFWAPLGVTQSCGSRYERDRSIPRPVVKLLILKYVKGIELDQITAKDVEIIRFLKQDKADLYQTLARAVDAR